MKLRVAFVVTSQFDFLWRESLERSFSVQASQPFSGAPNQLRENKDILSFILDQLSRN